MPPPLSFPPAQFRSQPLSLSLSPSTVVRISAPAINARFRQQKDTLPFPLICCRGFHALPLYNCDRCVSDPMSSEIDQFKCVYRGEKKRSLEEEGLVVRIVLNRRLDDRLSISDRVDRRPWPGWTEENYIASKSPIFSPSFFPLY